MTEKNIFVYKLFLSLRISDFSLFFMQKQQPPKKCKPLFPSNPPLKIEILSALPPLFWKFGRRLNPHPAEREGCTLCHPLPIYQIENSDTFRSFSKDEVEKKKKSFMAPFLWMGLEPLQGGSLLFTTKFPEITGAHFIDLGRMKG